MSDLEEARRELASIAASLRAYLECQRDSGAHGIPRRGLSLAARKQGGGERPAAVVEAAPALTGTPSPAVATLRAETPQPSPALPVRALPVVAQPPVDPAARGKRLAELAVEIAACMKCGLGATRTNTVVARGNPGAEICFVGEGPGADEDAQGIPFVGRAGQLLDRMIGAMGLTPENDVYIVNIVKCRPPENRKPTPDEMNACFPYLHEQLALVRPKVIVALGNTAVGALLGTKLGITKLRGEWKLYKGETLVMPTYHPSYLLRQDYEQSEAKREAWEDLQKVLRELGREPPPPKKRPAVRSR